MTFTRQRDGHRSNETSSFHHPRGNRDKPPLLQQQHATVEEAAMLEQVRLYLAENRLKGKEAEVAVDQALVTVKMSLLGVGGGSHKARGSEETKTGGHQYDTETRSESSSTASVRLLSSSLTKSIHNRRNPAMNGGLVELYVHPQQVKRLCGFNMVQHLHSAKRQARAVFEKQSVSQIPPYLCRLNELGPWRPISEEDYYQSMVALDFIMEQKQLRSMSSNGRARYTRDSQQVQPLFVQQQRVRQQQQYGPQAYSTIAIPSRPKRTLLTQPSDSDSDEVASKPKYSWQRPQAHPKVNYRAPSNASRTGMDPPGETPAFKQEDLLEPQRPQQQQQPPTSTPSQQPLPPTTPAKRQPHQTPTSNKALPPATPLGRKRFNPKKYARQLTPAEHRRTLGGPIGLGPVRRLEEDHEYSNDHDNYDEQEQEESQEHSMARIRAALPSTHSRNINQTTGQTLSPKPRATKPTNSTAGTSEQASKFQQPEALAKVMDGPPKENRNEQLLDLMASTVVRLSGTYNDNISISSEEESASENSEIASTSGRLAFRATRVLSKSSRGDASSLQTDGTPTKSKKDTDNLFLQAFAAPLKKKDDAMTMIDVESDSDIDSESGYESNGQTTPASELAGPATTDAKASEDGFLQALAAPTKMARPSGEDLDLDSDSDFDVGSYASSVNSSHRSNLPPDQTTLEAPRLLPTKMAENVTNLDSRQGHNDRVLAAMAAPLTSPPRNATDDIDFGSEFDSDYSTGLLDDSNPEQPEPPTKPKSKEMKMADESILIAMATPAKKPQQRNIYNELDSDYSTGSNNPEQPEPPTKPKSKEMEKADENILMAMAAPSKKPQQQNIYDDVDFGSDHEDGSDMKDNVSKKEIRKEKNDEMPLKPKPIDLGTSSDQSFLVAMAAPTKIPQQHQTIDDDIDFDSDFDDVSEAEDGVSKKISKNKEVSVKAVHHDSTVKTVKKDPPGTELVATDTRTTAESNGAILSAMAAAPTKSASKHYAHESEIDSVSGVDESEGESKDGSQDRASPIPAGSQKPIWSLRSPVKAGRQNEKKKVYDSSVLKAMVHSPQPPQSKETLAGDLDEGSDFADDSPTQENQGGGNVDTSANKSRKQNATNINAEVESSLPSAYSKYGDATSVPARKSSSANQPGLDHSGLDHSGPGHERLTYPHQATRNSSSSSYGMPPPPPLPLSGANLDITTLGGPPLANPAPVRATGETNQHSSFGAANSVDDFGAKIGETSAFTAVSAKPSNQQLGAKGQSEGAADWWSNASSSSEDLFQQVSGHGKPGATVSTPKDSSSRPSKKSSSSAVPMAATQKKNDVFVSRKKAKEANGPDDIRLKAMALLSRVHTDSDDDESLPHYGSSPEEDEEEDEASNYSANDWSNGAEEPSPRTKTAMLNTTTISSSSTGQTLLMSTRLSLKKPPPHVSGSPEPSMASYIDDSAANYHRDRTDSITSRSDSVAGALSANKTGLDSSEFSHNDESLLPSPQSALKPKLSLKISRIGGTSAETNVPLQKKPASPDRSVSDTGDAEVTPASPALPSKPKLSLKISKIGGLPSERNVPLSKKSPSLPPSLVKSPSPSASGESASESFSSGAENNSPAASPTPTKPKLNLKISRIGGAPSESNVPLGKMVSSHDKSPSPSSGGDSVSDPGSYLSGDVDESPPSSPAPKPKLSLKMTRIGGPPSETNVPLSSKSPSPGPRLVQPPSDSSHSGSVSDSGSNLSGDFDESPPPSPAQAPKPKLNLKMTRIGGPPSPGPSPDRSPSPSLNRGSVSDPEPFNSGRDGTAKPKMNLTVSRIGGSPSLATVPLKREASGMSSISDLGAPSLATVALKREASGMSFISDLGESFASDISPFNTSRPKLNLKMDQIGEHATSSVEDAFPSLGPVFVDENEVTVRTGRASYRAPDAAGKSRLLGVIDRSRSPMLSGSAEGSVMTDTSGSTMTSRSSISDKFARGVIRELGKAFVPESGPRVAEGFEDYDAAYYALENFKHFKDQPALKQATLSLIASVLMTQEEKDILDDIFHAIDLDRDGKLSKDDITYGLYEFCGVEEVSQEDLHLIFRRMGRNRSSDHVAFSEWCIGACDKNNMLGSEALQHAFAMFDKDNNGFISKEELMEVLPGAEDMVEAIIARVDIDGDGMLSFGEFLSMIFKSARVKAHSKEKEWKQVLPEIPESLHGSFHSLGSASRVSLEPKHNPKPHPEQMEKEWMKTVQDMHRPTESLPPLGPKPKPQREWKYKSNPNTASIVVDESPNINLALVSELRGKIPVSDKQDVPDLASFPNDGSGKDIGDGDGDDRAMNVVPLPVGMLAQLKIASKDPRSHLRHKTEAELEDLRGKNVSHEDASVPFLNELKSAQEDLETYLRVVPDKEKERPKVADRPYIAELKKTQDSLLVEWRRETYSYWI